jgi:hypothetical protein
MSRDLTDVVQAEYEYIASLEGGACIAAVPRFLELLGRHPIVSSVVADMLGESRRAEDEYTRSDSESLMALREIWADSGD